MSMGSSWQSFSSATPPDRGAFPMDIEEKCTPFVKKYLVCLKENKGDSRICRELSKAYLQCRMDNKLMEQDQLSNLGFK